MAAAEFVRILSEDFPELREIGNELAGIEDCPEVACFNCDPDSEDGRQGCCWEAWLCKRVGMALKSALAAVGAEPGPTAEEAANGTTTTP